MIIPGHPNTMLSSSGSGVILKDMVKDRVNGKGDLGTAPENGADDLVVLYMVSVGSYFQESDWEAKGWTTISKNYVERNLSMRSHI